MTKHAETALAEREIPLEWVDRVRADPGRTEPDANDAMLEHRLGVIPEHGNRLLRVMINRRTAPVRVVTAYFDRTLRNRI